MENTTKKVVVYSTPTCGYCMALKEYLKTNNIEFTEIDLSVDHAKAEEVVAKTGQMGVPVIEIDNEIIVGFDKAKIANALGLNKE